MARTGVYAAVDDRAAVVCRGTASTVGCYARIRAGRMAEHRATLGHQTRWTVATYRAHLIDTYGAEYVARKGW